MWKKTKTTMIELSKASTDAEIVKNLGESDPVYDATIFERVPIKELDAKHPAELSPDGISAQRRRYVKRCAICRAEGRHNEENVTHKNSCPWIWAMKLKYAARTAAPPQAEMPNAKLTDCGENQQHLNAENP